MRLTRDRMRLGLGVLRIGMLRVGRMLGLCGLRRSRAWGSRLRGSRTRRCAGHLLGRRVLCVRVGQRYLISAARHGCLIASLTAGPVTGIRDHVRPLLKQVARLGGSGSGRLPWPMC